MSKRRQFLGATLICAIVLSVVLTTNPVSAAQYEYDGLNRLTKVYSGTGNVIEYQYDATGNLLHGKVTTGDSVNVFLTRSYEDETTVSDSISTPPNISLTEQIATGDSINVLPTMSYEGEITSGDSVIISSLTGEVTTGDSVSVPSTIPSAKEIWVEGVSTGWTPFFIKGVTAHYHVANENKSNLPIQRLIVESEQPGAANVYRDFSVKKQQQYTISGWIAAEKIEQAAGQVVVNYYDEKNHFIGHENVVNVLQSSEWKPFTSTLSIPNGTVKARVHLQGLILQADGSGNFGFAALTFEPNLPI